MKTKTKVRIAVILIMLTTFLSINFYIKSLLVGTWERTYLGEDGNTYIKSYTFSAGGVLKENTKYPDGSEKTINLGKYMNLLTRISYKNPEYNSKEMNNATEFFEIDLLNNSLYEYEQETKTEKYSK